MRSTRPSTCSARSVMSATLPIGVATTYSAAAGYCCPCASSEREVMRQKTQTDGMRPSLCHAGAPGPGGVRARSASRSKQEPEPEPEPEHEHEPRPKAYGAMPHNFSTQAGSKLVGAAFETRAQEFLQRQRLRL